MTSPFETPKSWPGAPTGPAAAPAGYVTPTSPSRTPASPFSSPEFAAWRNQFWELLLQRVVEALVGIFLPTAGPAFNQLVDWATDLPGVGFVGELVERLTGIVGGDLGLLSPLSWLFPGIIDNGDGTLSILDGLFQDNSDGTWSFIENGVHTVIDSLDGTLMSPVSLLENIIGQLGTYQNTINQQQDIIDNVINALSQGTQVFGNQVTQLQSVLQSIPFLNVLGPLGPPNIGASLEASVNQILGGFLNVVNPVGGNLSDLFNVTNIIGSWANLGLNSFNILGIRNAEPATAGMLASSTTTVPLHIATAGTSANVVGVTSTTAITGWQRVEKNKAIGAIRWHGHGTTNITGFQVALSRIRPTNPQGATHIEHLYVSPDIVGSLDPGGSISLPPIQSHSLTSPVEYKAGDWVGVELIPFGSGTHSVAKQDIWTAPDPHVVPRRLASVRNQSTPMGASLLDIYDDFDVLDTGSVGWDLPYTFGSSISAKWDYSAGVSVVAGQLNLSSASNPSCVSVAVFDLTGGKDQILIEVPQVAPGTSATRFGIFSVADPNDAVHIYQINGTLWFVEWINGVPDQTSVAYNGTTHKSWRLRYNSGTMYWDTSTDGISWTNRRAKTIGAIDLTAVKVLLSVDAGTPAGTAKFDHLNIIPGEGLSTVTTIPLIETAVELGTGVEFHSAQSVPMDDDGTVAIPSWANTIQAVGVGGGGGGERGAPFNEGEGAVGGAWAATTWTRSTHFPSGGVVSFDIGAGGIGQNAGGSSGPTTGGATIISIPGYSIRANGGVPGTVAPIQSLPGKSPGNYIYDGVPYAGGGQQNTADAAGVAPGGGGAGGQSATSNRPGGPGANGRGWVRFIP